VHNLFSFGHVDFVNFAGQFHGLRRAERLLAGIVLRGHFQFVGRKKLLRFAAGLSAFAVIAPIDARHVLVFIKMGRNKGGRRLAESIILRPLPSTRCWRMGWRFLRQDQGRKSATLNLDLNLLIGTARPGAYVVHTAAPGGSVRC